MTRIIEFLIALGIVAGLFVVVGLVLPSERQMSESVETNRRMTIVYDTVNSFRRFKDWNPLVLRDPKIQLKLAGPEEARVHALNTAPPKATSVRAAGRSPTASRTSALRSRSKIPPRATTRSPTSR